MHLKISLHSFLLSFNLRIFEGHKLDLSAKNAGLIKNILLSSFYAPALPICAILSILGLIMLYWSDKVIKFKFLIRMNVLVILIEK